MCSVQSSFVLPSVDWHLLDASWKDTPPGRLKRADPGHRQGLQAVLVHPHSAREIYLQLLEVTYALPGLLTLGLRVFQRLRPLPPPHTGRTRIRHDARCKNVVPRSVATQRAESGVSVALLGTPVWWCCPSR